MIYDHGNPTNYQSEIDDVGLQLLSDMITRHYGARCDVQDKGCPVCDAWAFFDELEQIVREVNKVD